MIQICNFRIKLVLATLVLLAIPLLLFAAQPEDVSGVVNQTRAKVTGVGVDFVLVDDATGFLAGDTVLVIQMKGDGILTSNDTDFGKHQTHVGDVGYYEFVVIQLVEAGPKITFFNNLKGSYEPNSSVQVIKVESYETLNVTGELTVPAWNNTAGTGGVMAIFASDKIILNANITVSGKGFRGASGVAVDGTCLESSPYVAFFNDASTRAGRKGEGYSSHNGAGTPLISSLYTKGRGAIGAGGGGGDGALSGGGGGASYGYGGVGGEELGCTLPNAGGAGGYIINGYYNITSNLFYNAVIMGGGGGASGYSSGSSAPDGGNGGGIIFIMTDSIYGNGYSIEANGASVTEVSSLTSGGAGGGAAGSLVISANGYGTSGLNLEVKGGDGGDTPFGVGNGGGGSGGLIWVSPATYTDVTFDKSAGLSGNYIGISASDGDPGPSEWTNLLMNLNGFLFNTVVSAKDGNLVDSICYNQIPRALKASAPVGGTLPYTIFWEKSYTGVGGWVPLSGFQVGTTIIPDQAETSTLWIRRRIVDNSAPAIEDISKSVKIIVHPLITDFAIGHDTGDTICLNQDPTVIEPLVPIPGGGNSIYSYKWQQSSTGGSYNPTVLSTASSYDPPALSADTWYRRTVYSGACVDSTSFVKIRVLPLLAGNSIGATDTICEGSLFTDLSGGPLSGGDGTFRYKWEASLNNFGTVHTIEGTTDQSAYNPDENSTDFPSLNAKYFRRIVYSGEDDVCKDTSNIVNLVMQPAIANNGFTTALTQTVCAEDPVVEDVIGTTPTGGDNSYLYQWQYKTTGAWTDTVGATQKDLVLSSLYETTSFRRVVNSGVCTDISSDEFVVTVQPKIINNEISAGLIKSDTICYGQDPDPLSGQLITIGGEGAGTFTYLWESRTTATGWQNASPLNDGVGYDPGNLNETTYYRRKVFSGECVSISDTVTIVVLPLIGGNTIGSDQDVCFGLDAAEFTETAALTGGDGIYSYKWQSDTDPGFSAPTDIDTKALYQAKGLTTPTYYRRIVNSGKLLRCQDISNTVGISINPLPIAAITPAQDQTICEGESINLNLSVTTGTAPFSVVFYDGIDNLNKVHNTVGTLDHIFVPNYDTDQNLSYTLVSVSDANGCLASSLTGNKIVGLYEMPDANAGSPDEWCGFSGNLDAVASVGDGTWSWGGPSSIFGNENDPKTGVDYSSFINGDTSLTFKWKEVNVLERCADSASTTVRFWKPPTVALAGNDSTLLPFQVDMRLYANTPQYGTGVWSVISGDGEIKTGDLFNPTGMVQGMSDGLNVLEWRIVNGTVCADSFDELELTVPEVKLISGFSPNNDGINDFFVIDGLVAWDGNVVSNELVITDMTGVILYREPDYANDWDGRDMRGNPLPSGTYYYFINVNYSTRVQLKGFVIIKRD